MWRDKMPDLKLSRLPDRKPVKLTLALMPDLYSALNDYVQLYEAAYGRTERVEDLIPAMLASFLEGDRAFVRARGRP